MSTVRFPRAHRAPFAPEEPLVHHCERLLADAKTGKLRGLAYACVYHDDLSPAGFADHGYFAGSGTYYAVSHAIARLDRAWGRECDAPDKALDRPPGDRA